MEYGDDIFDISGLHLSGNFDSQVQQLLEYIRLTRAEVEHLQLLFDDLQSTLQTVWPGCQVHAFGSVVTGLGIKSSDVDCYISLPPWLQNPGDTYVTKAKATLRRRPDIFTELFAITGAKQKAILPPIYHLQRNVEYFVDNWNLAFQDIMHDGQLRGSYFKD
ncbi:unnamed protein product, partial [Iphiclides podalirius]